VKNFLATTLLSIGMPMIVMGDEVRRTQFGNNNAYCHDNEIGWFDWGLLPIHAGIYRFASVLIKRRVQRTMHHERHRHSLSHVVHRAQKSWHGVKLNQPDWGDSSHRFALTVKIQEEELHFHLIFNAQWDSAVFELPDKQAGIEINWQRWIDTSLDPPNDITNWEAAPPVSGYNYLVEARSVVVLIASVPEPSVPAGEETE
jgi:isoamylase